MDKTEKLAGTVAYLSIIGVIVAFFMNYDKKSEYVYFHIRQSIGVFATFFLISIFMGYFDSIMISAAFYISFFMLWSYGFITSLNSCMSPVPLLGKYYQKMFNMIGNN